MNDGGDKITKYKVDYAISIQYSSHRISSIQAATNTGSTDANERADLLPGHYTTKALIYAAVKHVTELLRYKSGGKHHQNENNRLILERRDPSIFVT